MRAAISAWMISRAEGMVNVSWETSRSMRTATSVTRSISLREFSESLYYSMLTSIITDSIFINNKKRNY